MGETAVKKMLLICTLFCITILSGCGKFDVVNRPPQGIAEAPQICIVQDPSTKDGFRDAIQSWLDKEGIESEVLPPRAPLSTCPWMLTYYGRWSWDVAIFLSDARITAYKDEKYAGEVALKVGQWDAYKFEDGEKRIHKMMDLLYSKVDKFQQGPTKVKAKQ